MKRYRNKYNHATGFSLLELIVVIIIISILFGLAINHLFKWRIAAEKASISRLTSEMRDALKLEVSSHYAKGRLQDVLKLVGTNPLEYVVEKPDTYLGSSTSPNLESIAPGSWMYDTTNKILIYRVRYPDNFETELSGIKRIEFKVSLIYADINRNKQFNRGVDTIEGLRLTSAKEYSWLVN